MRRGFTALLLGLLLVGATLAPNRADALSCIGLEEQLDGYALVVLGRVTGAQSVPSVNPEVTVTLEDGQPLRLLPAVGFHRSEVTMEVERYLKGAGPRTLTFVYTWSQYRWVPFTGGDVYIGLYSDPETQQYAASECSLVIAPTTRDKYEQAILARLHDTYGEGRPPQTPLRGQWLLWGAIGSLTATVGVAFVRRER